MSRVRAGADWRRVSIAIIFALVAGWLTIAIGLAAINRSANPGGALTLWPLDAGAAAKQAERLSAGLTADTSPKALAANRALAEQITVLAHRALTREPANVVAWRTLGLLAAQNGQGGRAGTLFALSERLSRRDFPTQLYFIEAGVTRNDIPDVLRHYDIALRSSTPAGDVLLPQLASATGTREVIAPLATLLRGAPPWRRAFYVYLAKGAPDSLNVAALLSQVARGNGLTDRDIIANIVNRMASDGDYAAAWQVYRLLRPGARSEAAIRNGGFDDAQPIPPFEWALTAGADIGGERQFLGIGSGAVLSIYANTATTGEVARQMLLLRPGNWRLALESGTPSDAAPAPLSITIVCLNQTASQLFMARLAPGVSLPDGGAFTVPTNCPAQWLILTASGTDQGNAAAWVDNVRVTSR